MVGSHIVQHLQNEGEGGLFYLGKHKALGSKPVIMNQRKLVLNIGWVCLLSGPIFFIIPFLMNHDDTTWGIALALWSIGLISVISGIVLLITGVLMKPEADGNTIVIDDVRAN